MAGEVGAVEGTTSHSGSQSLSSGWTCLGRATHATGWAAARHDCSVKHVGNATSPPMTAAHSRKMLIGTVARFMQGQFSLAGSLGFLVGPAARYCRPRHPYAF